MPFTADEIARHIGGEVWGDGSVQLNAIALAETARPGDLAFAETDGYFAHAEKSAASAILVDETLAATANTKVLIRVANARIAFAKVLALFFQPVKFDPGIHPSAIVAKSAQVDRSAHIGPWCVIGEGARIGPRSALQAGNHIGPGCVIGEDTNLFPNVTVYPNSRIGNRVTIHAGTAIGSDGYGYVFDQGVHRKVPQIGNVVIHDDVEIGANVTIDRGALGSTVIGKGTKIDNLVHVAHNVVMGNHCLIMGQVGFAGSTKLGDYCVIASQSGIAGHLNLGRQSTVGAKSGVMRDIPDGGTVLGIPAQPDKQTKRQWIAVQKLPDLMRELRELQQEIEQLKAARNS